MLLFLRSSKVIGAILLLVVLTSRSDTEGRSLRLPHVRGVVLRPSRGHGARLAGLRSTSGPACTWPRSGASHLNNSGASATARTGTVLSCQPARGRAGLSGYLAPPLLFPLMPRAGGSGALVPPWGAAQAVGTGALHSHACGSLLCAGRPPRDRGFRFAHRPFAPMRQRSLG